MFVRALQRQWSKLQKIFRSIYFKAKTKTLLNKFVEHAQQTKFQNFYQKKNSSQLVNTFSFPGSSSYIKRTLFFLEHLQVDCFLNQFIEINQYRE